MGDSPAQSGAAVPTAMVPKNGMDRFIDAIEITAAMFVGIVALDVFATVVAANIFRTNIPDSHRVGELLLGVLIFWGIAATSYRGTHITVDLLWANVGPKAKRAMDVFATLVLLGVVTTQTMTLFDKVVVTRDAHILTPDLRLPEWVFFALAWIGDVSAVLLIAIRAYRLIFQPERMASGVVAKAVE
jgi:TRAP-type C4-dicarboxylate transport system permease small subunit